MEVSKKYPRFYAFLRRCFVTANGLANDARWVTIGAKEDESTGKRKGGRPVLIDDNGNIIGGAVHPSMKGKPVNNPSTYKVEKHATKSATPTAVGEGNKNASQASQNPANTTPSAPRKEMSKEEFKAYRYNEENLKKWQEESDKVGKEAKALLEEFGVDSSKEWYRGRSARKISSNNGRFYSDADIKLHTELTQDRLHLLSDELSMAIAKAEGVEGDRNSEEWARLQKMRGEFFGQSLRIAKGRLDRINDVPYPLDHSKRVGEAFGENVGKFKDSTKDADPRAETLMNKLFPSLDFHVYTGGKFLQPSKYESDQKGNTVHAGNASIDGEGTANTRPFHEFVSNGAKGMAYRIFGNGDSNIVDYSGMADALTEELNAKRKAIRVKLSEDVEKKITKVRGLKFNDKLKEEISMQILGRVSPSFVAGLNKSLFSAETGKPLKGIRDMAVMAEAYDSVSDVRDVAPISDLLSSMNDGTAKRKGVFFPQINGERGRVHDGEHYDYQRREIKESHYDTAKYKHPEAYEFFGNMFALDILGDKNNREAIRKFLPKSTGIYDEILDIAK